MFSRVAQGRKGSDARAGVEANLLVSATARAIITDPFGQVWLIATHIEDVQPDEISQRMQAGSPELTSACYRGDGAGRSTPDAISAAQLSVACLTARGDRSMAST